MKKLSKKHLSFTTERLRLLNQDTLGQAQGGATTTIDNCRIVCSQSGSGCGLTTLCGG
jgi:hypothetical protein